LDELRQKIREFLIEFKEIMLQRGLDVIPRKENIDALAELGLTRKNRTDEIMNLAVEDYCSGPELDNDRPGYVWIFGKQINGMNIYIKLKIAEIEEQKIAKCLSFHKAQYPLCFPCKERSD